jgi:hypothetical protein
MVVAVIVRRKSGNARVIKRRRGAICFLLFFVVGVICLCFVRVREIITAKKIEKWYWRMTKGWDWGLRGILDGK